MSCIELRSVRRQYALASSGTLRALGRLLVGRRPDAGGRDILVAIDDLSLDIRAGERVGIIGENGAGKSTLLQLIAGISTVDAGEVRVEGHVTSVLTLGVGIRDEQTGRENIYLDGELQGRTRAQVDEVIGAITDFAELGEFIDRPVRTYSTGMKARLAFAMVSHLDPDILLIDEALSVGDAAFSAKASRRIREICARGKIVLVVSHNLDAINEICGRCLWLENGRIKMDGAPLEVTRAYRIAVRERDERELALRFDRLAGALERIEGYAVTRLALSSPSGAVLRVGDPLTVRIEIGRPASAAPLAVRLVVERLDGLVLVDETVPAEGDILEAELPGMLASGTYKVGVELRLGRELAAARSRTCELVAERRLAGGRPALAYPYSVSVEATHG